MAKESKSGKASKKCALEVAQGDTMASQNAQGLMRTEEVPSMADKVIINQDNTKTALLKLPAEIKQKIWILAITVNESIEPIQLRERSNKFLWSKGQVGDKGVKIVKNAPTLTAVQLSRVCRTLYEEVALTHLFYKVNHFQFTAPTWLASRVLGPINYLVALTSPRMKAIRSVICDWSSVPKEASKLFTVLATCEGLQELTLGIHSDFSNFNYHHPNGSTKADLFTVPGYREALIAVEGVQILELKICTLCCTGHFHMDRFRPAVTTLDLALREQMKEPRGKTKYSLETLLIAQQQAELNIHGDGRLGEDKKPGIVASRTRHQLRKLESLTDDGTIPKVVIPKYDADGDLAWHVDQVLASRRSEPDGFPPSVEFRVKCHSLFGVNPWDRSDLPPETTWEDIAVMNSRRCRQAIYFFYNQTPSAYGKDEVVEAWNVRDHDSSMTPKELGIYRGLTKAIVSIIDKQSKIEEREAEDHAKQAAKAVRAAAKAAKEAKMATKAKKTKTTNH